MRLSSGDRPPAREHDAPLSGSRVQIARLPNDEPSEEETAMSALFRVTFLGLAILSLLATDAASLAGSPMLGGPISREEGDPDDGPPEGEGEDPEPESDDDV